MNTLKMNTAWRVEGIYTYYTSINAESHELFKYRRGFENNFRVGEYRAKIKH